MNFKAKVIFIILTFISSVLLGLQVRSFRKVELLVQRSMASDLLAQLRTFQLANEQLREHIAEEENALKDINATISKEPIEDEINRLRLVSGEEAVSGPGVEMMIGSAIEEFWISDLIALVSSVGAEAIGINDIRLLTQTAGLRKIGDGMKMRHHYLEAPIKISIIGPKEELLSVLAQGGGIIDRMQNANPNLTVLLAARDSLVLP